MVSLDHLGHESCFRLNPDACAEIIDDTYMLRGRAESLQVIAPV